MRIFHKKYYVQLREAKSLENVIEILEPWADEVLEKDSAFMRQVASCLLYPTGRSMSPRFFKTVMAHEICRLTGKEDLHAILMLSIVEVYRTYDPKKGTDLVNWLAWRIPYEMSKWVTWRIAHAVEPIENYWEIEYHNINSSESRVDIIGQEIKLDSKQKEYYLSKGD